MWRKNGSSPISEALRVKVETYTTPKVPLQCKRCQRFGQKQRNCGHEPRCMACGDAHPSGTWVTSKQQLRCCSCGGDHTANCRGCCKRKEARAAAEKRAQGERSAYHHQNHTQLGLLPNRGNWAHAGTTWSEAAAS
jgi:hypothetical protein